MKTFFKSILAVAVCASLFAACSKDDTVSDPSNGRKVTMTVTASSELESASGSRTTYDPLTGKISWNETGEYLQVFETAASKTTYANSQEGTVSDGTAKFAVSFPENTNTPLVYNAVYPASAWVTSNNTDITNMKVVTRTSQQPTATSFDSNADLLIAKSISLESQPTELQMSFGRAVAIGKMTVKNLASEEPVLGVEFTAPDKKVTGRSYVDMTAGTVKEYGYPGNFSDNVTLSYSSEMNLKANGATGMTAYFTCFPFEVAAGETFTVTVTTATKIFTKTVTVQEGRALAFAAGDSSTFAVDMTDAAEETTETLSGDYVITATQSEITYAMSSLADGSRLAPVVITPSNPYKTGDETLIWTITKSGDNYTISQGKNYLSWESDNSATISTEAYDLIITKDKDKGTYQIASAATPSRILAKNNTANLGFGFYTGSQTKDLTLIPAEYVKLPQITLDPSTLTLSYNDTETHYIPVTLKNAETQDVSVAIYDGTEGTEQPDWITTGDYNGSENRLEVAATENTVATPRTARIVLTATTSLGTANATLLITQNSKPEGGVGETWTYTFESADKDKIAAGLTVNGLTWTASKAPTAFDTNSGIRGLSWSKPSGVTIKTSDYTGGIKKITLVMSANTANLSTVNATVGGQALGETISLAKKNNQEYVVESETPLSGEIVLTLNTESGGKSLMIKTITINCNSGEGGGDNPSPDPTPGIATPSVSDITSSTAKVSSSLTDAAYATEVQFFYSATNGSDTGSVVAFVSGNEATANLSDLLPATTYTVYGVVTATNGSTPQSSSTTFTTEGARTDHAAWYELPAKDNAGSNMLLRTFYDTARNYTMYYDTSTYTAYWVAYPLAAGDLGSGRPNDPWAATPGIPTSQQINVWAGSYGVNVGSTSNIYARGHQIPNADRNKDPYGTMCAQTFYATNSTPQIQNGFNSGIWSTLEGDVRTLAQQQTDTVYVVTGAILRTVTGNETITYIKPAKDTKNCPVPNYYYKVLLKVKREASGKISSASTVGVWLPHRVYSGESYQSYTKSVAEIEALTGYNFFANLPADIQAAAEQNSNWSTFASF